ncbi:MAG: hypothetical protein HY081_10795 [Gammaproteobacteria bacterium]|nr:hypothetical protein [Gammaproteobacteria bacterium]
MSAFSIYQKPCPACGALVSTSAQRCDCGYAFGSGNDAPLPEEQVLQDEELFEAYLTARVDQMVAAVETARVELMADPNNSRKTVNLVQAIQEALSLRDQREAQAAKILDARQQLQIAHGKNPLENNSSTPTDAFRAQQAAKVEKIMEAFENTKTKKCPHCKTTLPITSALCLCGYVFARDDFLLPRLGTTGVREKIHHSTK